MANVNIIEKWKPTLESFFRPIELEEEILEMIATYMESKFNKQYTIVTNPYSSTFTQPNEEVILDKIKLFKEKLLKESEANVNIKSTYYNSAIKKMVYELENGDFVYLDAKPFIIKDTSYIKKTKNLFMSVVDPTNPLLRESKINEIKSKI
jgi:hypothetical protein